MVIWSKSAKFHTSKRQANQVRFILKKCLYFDFEIPKVSGQINREEHLQIKFPKLIETLNLENVITIEHRDTSILTQ